MNDRYFGCRQCRTYVDAGYRWAYWQLEEPGLVAIGEPVSIDAVFSATEYWSPQGDDNNRWLTVDVLPRVRRYLNTHRHHAVIYIELDMIIDPSGLCASWTELTDG